MAILISGITAELSQGEKEAMEKARRMLKVPSGQIRSCGVYKVSIDARKKQVKLVYTVRVELTHGERQTAARLGEGKARVVEETQPTFPFGTETVSCRPIVVGFGPAGMFAALVLARQGFRPLVLERGEAMEDRVGSVSRFWSGGQLNPASNVQFGEGGAGTFSDGKLTTRIHDPFCRFVLGELVHHGAPSEILMKAKPHIGTDLLRDVVRSIRQEILSLGGEIRFRCQVEDLDVQDGKIRHLIAQGEKIPAEDVVLAIGHSARDTFSMLMRQGVSLTPKPFSVGVRIEHLQRDLDSAMYGPYAGHPALPPAEYQLSYRRGEDCCYTFCMCPGGTVVPAASQNGMVVVNGMSEFARDGVNANSAVVVNVDEREYGSGPLDGISYQQRLEQAAYELGGGGYVAPCQRVGDFLENSCGILFGPASPSYAIGVRETDLSRLFTPRVTGLLRDGLQSFHTKIRGFASDGALITGVETRTSSPVRIPRGEDRQSLSLRGLYPCGEGAGYAGGIMSAAVDGIYTAQAIIGKYCRPKWE